MIDNKNAQGLSWLKNGIWALGLAGLYSIILVIVRTPQLSHLIEDKSLFKSSLIIHVNLSVLVWLLSITSVIWSYGERKFYFETIFNKLTLAGMILMAISPLIERSTPVMNNYIPILENIWFIIGLSLFGISLLGFSILVCINSFFEYKSQNYILSIVKITSCLMYINTWICFALSYWQIDELTNIFPIDLDHYYELLFWSGGHLLQFIYTQILMLVWIVLAEIYIQTKLRYYKTYCFIFIINFMFSLLIFYGHFAYQISDYEFKEFSTKHMQYLGGIAPTIFIAILLVDIIKNKIKHHKVATPSFIPTAFFVSIMLFFAGGLIGILISGINLSIPAHYHGSIVGISLAFLGFAYIFCFRHNIKTCGISDYLFANISPQKKTLPQNDIKLANTQLIIITIGQLLHISGLALAGGYGILRKNPDGEIAISAKIYMGMMGGGGLIAIIGGLMFVYICAKKLIFTKEFG